MPDHRPRGEWAIRRIARLSKRLTVEFTIGPGGFTAEWTPAVPKRLTKAEFRRYRTARDQCAAECAARLGGRALLVEL